MPRRNFLLRLSYDGARFSGWQRQDSGVRTVQGELESALSRLLGETVSVTGAGRTDAGVHAEGQGASFHSRTLLGCEEILASLTQALPSDLSCSDCREVDPRFHARFRAKSKTYRYRFILDRDGKSPRASEGGPRAKVLTGSQMQGLPVEAVLDIAAMSIAAAAFEGEHEFAAFTNAVGTGGSRRSIDRAWVEVSGQTVDLFFTASGFLTNQARIMASAVLEAGRGHLSTEEIRRLLRGAERREAPGMLPAWGLCLVDVRY